MLAHILADIPPSEKPAKGRWNLATESLVIIAANTHQAVNTLLRKVAEQQPHFRQQASSQGFVLTPLQIIKLHSSEIESDHSTGEGISDLVNLRVTELQGLLNGQTVVLGGTTGAILKSMAEIQKTAGGIHLRTPLLVVDEASMMVFPHLLAPATFVSEGGSIMLAGDHRQLSPIQAHDWLNEDRPPVMLYKPYVSAYQAVWDIHAQRNKIPFLSHNSLTVSQLSHTFRLPHPITTLIGRLYQLDDLQLQGRPVLADAFNWHNPAFTVWQKPWQTQEGIFLITHNERLSKKKNPVEAGIIAQLMQHAPALDPKTVAIVTPHRAQRALLKSTLTPWGGIIDLIETVEKLQGGERDNIIVSATASDPAAIGNYTEFILNLNRANVAFSRPRKRLFVVCSEELLNYIPSESENYQTALLWKELRNYCNLPIGEITFQETHQLRFFTCNPGG